MGYTAEITANPSGKKSSSSERPRAMSFADKWMTRMYETTSEEIMVPEKLEMFDHHSVDSEA